jgi:hypothetical protein
MTEAVSKVLTKNIMKCDRKVVLNQTIDVSGDYNIVSNAKMRQGFEMSTTCFQDVSMMAQIQNEMFSEIKAQAKAQSVAVLGVLGNSDSETDTKIRNSINNEITSETMNLIVTNVNQSQGISVSGNHNIVENVDLEQLTNLVEKASQSVVSNLSVINTLANSVEAKSESSQTNPLDFIANMLGALMSGPIIVILLIIAAVMGFLWIFRGIFSGSASPTENYYSQNAYDAMDAQSSYDNIYPVAEYSSEGYAPEAYVAQPEYSEQASTSTSSTYTEPAAVAEATAPSMTYAQ